MGPVNLTIVEYGTKQRYCYLSRREKKSATAVIIISEKIDEYPNITFL